RVSRDDRRPHRDGGRSSFLLTCARFVRPWHPCDRLPCIYDVHHPQDNFTPGIKAVSMNSGIPLQSPQDFLIIAHRGALSYAPENTIAAFDLALQMGSRHLELDVHLTSDDHLIVIHYDTVDRTTNSTGPVASQTLAALQTLDAGAWFREAFVGARIPALAE